MSANRSSRSIEVQHFFTVDVEEHFQVSAFERFVDRAAWETLESRVARNVERLLEFLAAHETRGTFFVLGWIAEKHADVVRAISDAGHEIASHGWGHRRVTELTPDAFRKSVRRSKAILEDLIGCKVVGYRAPSFSIVRGREWALDILIEEGYRYDSSLFPIKRRGYGYVSGGRDPHWIDRPRGGIYEVPPCTLRRVGQNLPAAGGAYFRIFPYALVRAAFEDAAKRGVPGTFYVHPWEVDPDQPRVAASAWSRFRHYTGLRRTLPRLRRLLSEFRFRPIAENLAAVLSPATS